jgi:1-acyl-sn-glycerol-3-phosphate acyltransferase
MEPKVLADDQYETEPGQEKLLHRLLFRSRIYYIVRFCYIVFHAWATAKSRHFTLDDWVKSSFRVFKSLEDCGGRFHIKGLFNFTRTDSPVVFVGNHMSTLETVVLPYIIAPLKKCLFVVKEQLKHVPFFGILPRSTGCIGVKRENPVEDFKEVMSKGSEMIAKGYSIIIFPQSTRHTTFDPSKFNTLGIKLARKNKVPVVPIALKTNFWGNGKTLKDFGPLDLSKKIYFEFGEPITIHGSGKEEHAQVVSFIKSRLEKWEKTEEEPPPEAPV